MPKRRKAKGKKVAPAPAVVKKQEAKKVVNPLFEKRPKNSALDRTSSPKEIEHASSNGPTTSGCSGKEPSSISGSKSLLPLTRSPRRWTGRQLLSCLSLPTSTGQRRSKGYWPVLRRKLLAKATSQLRDRLSSEQESIQSPPWWRTRRLSWW
ncbi:unnamed protein product [Tetraodon nigroviridis]|jgi:hypothetical protein|uniref:Chromosome undetermined SCAF17368, whole genome shotgun sequence n=1 Tax=Tetraodon nigroviridis TaxID=99883 RepID=Q4RD53_TETNG|nr:unnamed protein product [Tetraodon nigroviridis]